MTSFRVRASFTEQLDCKEYKFWIYVDKKSIKTVGDLEKLLSKRLLFHGKNVTIKIDNYILLADDPIDVISETDLLEVECKNDFSDGFVGGEKVGKNKTVSVSEDHGNETVAEVNGKNKKSKKRKRKHDKDDDAQSEETSRSTASNGLPATECIKTSERSSGHGSFRRDSGANEVDVPRNDGGGKDDKTQKSGKKRKRNRKHKNKTKHDATATPDNGRKNLLISENFFRDSDKSDNIHLRFNEELPVAKTVKESQSKQTDAHGVSEPVKNSSSDNSATVVESPNIIGDASKSVSEEIVKCSDKVTNVKVNGVENYDSYPVLKGPPRLNDKIAFKVLELSEEYSPILSEFKSGHVAAETATGWLIKLDQPQIKKTGGKFDLSYEHEDAEECMVEYEHEIVVDWNNVVDARFLGLIIQ